MMEEEFKITGIYKVNSQDVFKDNNDGFIYGVEWEINDGFIYDIMWFKTREERNDFIIKELKGGIKEDE